MKIKISLPNTLLISSVVLLAFIPSVVVLGLVFIMALHANATRLSRFKKQEQAAQHVSDAEGQEARIKLVEDELKKVMGAVNLSKLGR